MPIRKRSIVVDGHKTSVSLEEEFWLGVKQLARSRHITIGQLAQEAGAMESSNLSSALRLMLLKDLVARSNAGSSDRAMMLKSNLALVQQHIAEGQSRVAEQRERVTGLRRLGHATEASGMLLRHFEELLALHVAHRDRLTAELAGMGAL